MGSCECWKRTNHGVLDIEVNASLLGVDTNLYRIVYCAESKIGVSQTRHVCHQHSELPLYWNEDVEEACGRRSHLWTSWLLSELGRVRRTWSRVKH